MELVRHESSSSTKVRHQLTFGISLGLAVSGVGYEMVSIFIVVEVQKIVGWLGVKKQFVRGSKNWWEVKAWLDFWTLNLGLGRVNWDMLKL